ncbi:GatB/YqeY domain-containing protein [Temperatibacter marinus]|uniref:GatB/YqeY domain-containing protein n=1 Tax=Temperatibacter marinus TaxID=1456591 RepID=A0AA52H841_9PROT|nr:GatB/YqeY domain-containing protein [Temperatibacter marinus]WND01731.1 GatB/YqeY domain-containing protein [Temperatibacter marinus]
MLRDTLSAAMKDAMRNKEKKRLTTIRLINAAIKEFDIDNRTKEDEVKDEDAAIIDILSKMVKQRKDSIKAYEEAGRCELAEQEKDEIKIIEDFLPRQLNEEEIEAAAKAIVTDLGAEGLKDIGRCMAALKDKHAGSMDFAKASGIVKGLLS